MKLQRYLAGLFLLLIPALLSGQDRDYARRIIDTLASPSMYGRGYVNKGDSIAAAYIAGEFQRWNLQSFGNDYFQHFTLSVNSFPGTMKLAIDGLPLIAGETFSVSAVSHGDKGMYPVRTFNQKWLEKPRRMQRFFNRDHSGAYVYYDLDFRQMQSREIQRAADSVMRNNLACARGSITTRQAISWHAWSRPLPETPFTSLQIRQDYMPPKPRKIEVDIENRWFESYDTRNVIGYVEGKLQPDTFYVFTAHFDHIGMMGAETMFPGANDNASGTAMLIDLARHFSLPENRPDYSIAFMAFAAEETGLLGSKFYTENPLFPLENIRYLVNLDMVGTGSGGMFVFNGTTDTLRFELMSQINDRNNYLAELRMRGVSRSSDHYYFHTRDVPAFFVLTFGDEHRHYHNIYDTREATPLTKYSEVFRLLIDFIDEL
jgi:aminopeptidase YwaD